MQIYNKKNFRPLHINANKNDFLGNNNLGRYMILPGSDNRAQQIASKFNDLQIKKSNREYNLYIGNITINNITMDIGTISTGIGAGSADIVISELLGLGNRNFMRLGTAGCMQLNQYSGEIAIATGCVKDESTSKRYLPESFPAIASYEIKIAAELACKYLKINYHSGIFHSKDSFYARELGYGPKYKENMEYMKLLQNAGVVASEMETSILFTLSQIANSNPNNIKIFCGAICILLGEGDNFPLIEDIKKMEDNLINVGINTYLEFHKSQLILK